MNAEVNKMTIERFRHELVVRYKAAKSEKEKSISELEKCRYYLVDKESKISNAITSSKDKVKSSIHFDILKIMGILVTLVFMGVMGFVYSENFFIGLISIGVASILPLVRTCKNLSNLIAQYNHSTNAIESRWDYLEAEALEKERINETKVNGYSNQLTYMEKQYGRLGQELKDAETLLSDLYKQGLLPEKYRGNIVAITAFNDYLTSGRCDYITGHGGIYDTYEHDELLKSIRAGIDELIWQNARMLSQLGEISSEIKKSNQMMTTFHQSLERDFSTMSRTLNCIEENTSVIAVHQNNIDANLQYMRWSQQFA